MRSRLFRICILLLLTALACSLPERLLRPAATPSATATSSPFLPSTPSPSFTPSPGFEPPSPSSPTPELFLTSTTTPTPTIIPFRPTPTPPRIYPTLLISPTTTSTPPPAPLLIQPGGQVNLLLLGADQRPNETDFHTDTILLLIIKPDGSASLFSFPRDLLVYIPGFRMGKINLAYTHGGFETLAMTLEYNFGIRPHHFLLTNFNGFKSVVDSLNGIDVKVAQSFTDARTGYPNGYTVEPGIVHMDGETALWYVRARMTTSDFDRLRRAQEVIVAIGQKLLSRQALNHIPEFYKAYRSSVETNLSLEDLLGLQPLLQAVDQQRLTRYTIPREATIPWNEPGTGFFYLIPKTKAIQQLLQQAIGNP